MAIIQTSDLAFASPRLAAPVVLMRSRKAHHDPAAVAAIRRLDKCATCEEALHELAELDAAQATHTFGPNALNVVMRRCSGQLETAEALFARLGDGSADCSSFEIIAAARLQHGALETAAAAAAAGLASCVVDNSRCSVKLARTARRVLDECSAARVPASEARERWRELDERGALPPGFHFRGGTGVAGASSGGARPSIVHLRLERTLAVLKPDALREGHADAIVSVIRSSGFEVLARRRWRMSEAEAASFLATSWGSAKRGDMRRTFFTSMAAFYSSGECEALLLERPGAIGAWRAMLGPGDPAAGRVAAPLSIRARFGSTKQANAAHGADSIDAVQRECEAVFGEGRAAWASPGVRLEGAAGAERDDAVVAGLTIEQADGAAVGVPPPSAASRAARARARR